MRDLSQAAPLRIDGAEARATIFKSRILLAFAGEACGAFALNLEADEAEALAVMLADAAMRLRALT